MTITGNLYGAHYIGIGFDRYPALTSGFSNLVIPSFEFMTKRDVRDQSRREIGEFLAVYVKASLEMEAYRLQTTKDS